MTVEFETIISSVPEGFRILSSYDFFCVGDIVADCEGKWRGPVTVDSDLVGRDISSYLCSATEGVLPPIRAAARKAKELLAEAEALEAMK